MRNLQANKHWHESRERFIRWWKHDETDRPIINLTTTRADIPDNTPEVIPPENPQQAWLDLDDIIARKKAQIARTEYLGDAFPYIHPAIGPGALGAYIGSHPEFSIDTVWYEKCADSPAEASGVLDENNEWWQWTLDYTKRIIDADEGDFLPALPDMIENMDTIAQLIGTIETVYAAGDQPDQIHRLQEEVLASYFTAYNTLSDMMFPDKDESVFMGFDIWGPGRISKLQTDIAALMSPDMFREFALPYFNRQIEQLDYALYHLDGPDALYSLDILTEIKGLNAIQWVPGAGNPPASDPVWDHVWKKILDSGKSLWGYLPDYREAVGFKKKWGSKGVFLALGNVPDPDTAHQLMRDLS